jgi:hypothetical protein
VVVVVVSAGLLVQEAKAKVIPKIKINLFM